jgi:hypothetical protein
MGSRYWQTCTVRRSEAGTPYWLPLLLIRDRFKTWVRRQVLLKQAPATSSCRAVMCMSSRTAEAPAVPAALSAFSTVRNAAICTTWWSGRGNSHGRTGMWAWSASVILPNTNGGRSGAASAPESHYANRRNIQSLRIGYTSWSDERFPHAISLYDRHDIQSHE